MATWQNVPKPTASLWTSVNPAGKEQYDQASLTYDDSSTYYDGVNLAQWTAVAKPSVVGWMNVPKPI